MTIFDANVLSGRLTSTQQSLSALIQECKEFPKYNENITLNSFVSMLEGTLSDVKKMHYEVHMIL